MSENDKPELLNNQAKERREFLRKSIYAAYATPIVISLLVEKADAAQSWNPGKGNVPPNSGKNPWGSAPPPWVP